jgi:hemerythrin superfamily protein
MARSDSKPKSNGLDISDLNGDVSSPLMPADGHFGFSSEVWTNAQRIADALPFPVVVHGDINEEIVNQAIENSKGMKLQSNFWKEYSTAIQSSLKEYYKILEKQGEVVENVAEARLRHAEFEKDLTKNLASIESRYRQVIGNSRSAIAGIQDELNISLNKIVAQHSQSAAKRQESLANESSKPRDGNSRKIPHKKRYALQWRDGWVNAKNWLIF